MEIPNELREYFSKNSNVWKEQFQDCNTYSKALQIIHDLKPSDAGELLGVAISYVSAATNEITIYQEALAKLRKSEENVVDEWLSNLGFTVNHNKLGSKLVQKISWIFQNIMQVINNFIQSIVRLLNVKLDNVQFQFSASPAVSLTFK